MAECIHENKTQNPEGEIVCVNCGMIQLGELNLLKRSYFGKSHSHPAYLEKTNISKKRKESNSLFDIMNNKQLISSRRLSKAVKNLSVTGGALARKLSLYNSEKYFKAEFTINQIARGLEDLIIIPDVIILKIKNMVKKFEKVSDQLNKFRFDFSIIGAILFYAGLDTYQSLNLSIELIVEMGNLDLLKAKRIYVELLKFNSGLDQANKFILTNPSKKINVINEIQKGIQITAIKLFGSSSREGNLPPIKISALVKECNVLIKRCPVNLPFIASKNAIIGAILYLSQGSLPRTIYHQKDIAKQMGVSLRTIEKTIRKIR